MTFTRTDNRAVDELRAVKITPNFLANAEGSALIEMGNTRVICAASVEEKLPPHLRGQRTEGWVTAEYGMLPRSTHTRTNREIGRGGPSGRTHEIQRLIGRSLRSIANRKVLGERTITLDCDVLQADGGTRTAAITGAYVAFAIACRRLMNERKINKSPIISEVAAIIQEQYGVTTRPANQTVGNRTIFGILPNYNLDVLLKALEATSEFQVVHQGGEIIIQDHSN